MGLTERLPQKGLPCASTIIDLVEIAHKNRASIYSSGNAPRSPSSLDTVAVPTDDLTLRLWNLESGQEKPCKSRSKRVFEKSHAGAIRLSIRRIAARSIIVSEVWTRYS